jgi:co-chaperonin GroES (HSP10)
MTTLKPHHNYVLVRVLQHEEETTDTGIILPSGHTGQKPSLGIIEKIGPDVQSDFKVGDKVLFPPYIGDMQNSTAQAYVHERVNYLFIVEDAILATIVDD